MANNNQKNEIQIELTPDVATGHYANLAIISHSANEFFLDFINVAPNMPKAKVQSRVIMTPENAKNLLFALRNNVQQYEKTFGDIEQKKPLQQGGDNNIPNPFMA